MEPLCANCQHKFIPQSNYNRTMQYYKMCETCRPIKTKINLDCVNYDKYNTLITDLHQSIETNKQVLKVVEGERSSITYLIQTMNSDLVKLKVNSDNVIDINIQNEIIRLKDRMNNSETVFNTRFTMRKRNLSNILLQQSKKKHN